MSDIAVVEVAANEDVIALRRRLRLVDVERVVLVLPWQAEVFAAKFDFDLIRRQAVQQGFRVAVVSPDFERRVLVREHGLPAFETVEEAQDSPDWPLHPWQPVEPPPRRWWQPPQRLLPRRRWRVPWPWFRWVRLVGKVLVLLLTLFVLAGSAYAVVPRAEVHLVPAGREFSTIVPVSMDPDYEAIDSANRLIPAKRIGVYVEGHIDVETTGVWDMVSGLATGEVLFTNLLAQDYMVSAGTIVRTSSTSYPVRFRTTSDVMVPAAGQARAPIEALQEGVPNVQAYQINRVEGVAASAVRVINPAATTGAEYKPTRVVVQADQDRAWRQLATQLMDQAYADMQVLDELESTEIVLRQSLRIESVPKEAYTHLVAERAERVGLDLRLLVSGLAMDSRHAQDVAQEVLLDRLPEGYMLVDSGFDLGEVAEEDIGPGAYTVFVTAKGYAAVSLDREQAIDLVRGQRITEAQERLMASFPLAEVPRMEVWPESMERMPQLPIRISVRVLPQGASEAQSASMAP